MSVLRSNYVIVVSGLFLLLSGSCKQSNRNNNTDEPITPVSAVAVTNKPFDNNLSSFGSITYKIKNDLTVQVAGTITRLYVKEGDEVRNGQRMAVLRNVQLEIQREQYENELDSAKAALFMAETKMREAKLNVESRLLALEKNYVNLRQKELELEEEKEVLLGRKELHEIGGITDLAYKSNQLSVSAKEADTAILRKEIEIARLGLRDQDLIEGGYEISGDPEEKRTHLIELNTRSVSAEIEAAKANVRNSEKNIDSVQKLLDELTVRSSVSGVVGALYYEDGEFVPQNEKIATVMDIATVYAIFYIQEQDIINFSIGTSLYIEIPSLNKTIEAAIDEISPIADPQSGNFSIKAEIQNDNLSMKPGMFVKCVIPREREVFYPAVPETALVRSNGSEGFVFSVINGFAVLKPVQIQAQKDGTIWIASGLSDNDVVVDHPSPFLKEGEHVAYN